MLSDDEIARRRDIAITRRQQYEEAHRIARQRARPADYEAAMQAAIEYAAVQDGLIAALIRERESRQQRAASP